MIKLSDYLNYLNDEVIKARKLADESAVEMAKIYSKHEYLKYFRVPRFTMPSVNLEIPIKISELDSETRYEFKIDENKFIKNVNLKIEELNKKENLNLKPIDQAILEKNNFNEIIDKLKGSKEIYVRKIDDHFAEIDFSKGLVIRGNSPKLRIAEVKANNDILNDIIKDVLRNNFKPISAKLNDIFVDPNTTKESDKDKIMVMLNAELVEEGIKIRKLIDKNGKEIEEIIFE